MPSLGLAEKDIWSGVFQAGFIGSTYNKFIDDGKIEIHAQVYNAMYQPRYWV
jgi:hypothetical protein